MSNAHRAAGFTLIEMLVALAAFGLLVTSATAILGISLRSQENLNQADAVLRQVQLARAIIKADLAQLAPRPVRDRFGGGQPIVLAGGSAMEGERLLSFVRRGWDNPSEADPRSTLQRVEYLWRDGRLIRLSWPRLDPNAQTPEHSAVLLENVHAVKVQFLGGGAWSDGWRATAANPILPEAVSLDAEIAGLGAIRQIFLAAIGQIAR